VSSIGSQNNSKIGATIMSNFKAKMHPIRLPLGLRPRHRWGSLQRSPDSSKGREGRERHLLRTSCRECVAI